MKKKKLYLVFCLLSFITGIHAQSTQEEYFRSMLEGNPIKVTLWENGAPNSNGMEADKNMPELSIYLPKADKPTKAVVICPGGSYAVLAIHHEGTLWRDLFMNEGIAAIVLAYRLPYGHTEVPASDVYEAIRTVKAHAEEWNIDPDKIGIMGSSAGGHLASTVATHASDDVRPAFQILLYPVISMDDRYTHKDSKKNLLGENPTEELIKLYSNELQVTSKTPKAILLLADDDDVVNPLNSTLYYEALKAHDVPASLYIYPTGGHGFGILDTFAYKTEMVLNLKSWLRSLE